MSQSKVRIALDVGEKRIGVAVCDGIVTIARPLKTLEVDGTETKQILTIIGEENVDEIIIGYPRNQSGEPTAQTRYVEEYKKQLAKVTSLPIIFQDESLTSVLSEERLKSYGKPYEKADIDMQAAALILQDYMESSNGRI